MAARTACPECGSRDQYQGVKPIGSVGGDPPNFLRGLGRWYRAARFEVIVCQACGLTRWYAEREARGRLRQSPQWERVG